MIKSAYCLSLCTKIFRSDIIKKYDMWFPESLKAQEDVAFNFMYITIANTALTTDTRLYNYFLRGDSITDTTDAKFFKRKLPNYLRGLWYCVVFLVRRRLSPLRMIYPILWTLRWAKYRRLIEKKRE